MSSTQPLPSASPPIWENQARKLRQWYFIYLGCWLGGIILFLIGFQVGSNAVNHAALFLFFGSLVPYVISMVYACKVQGNLHAAGLMRAGAWSIVLAALIIIPLVGGFYVPLSVLLSVRSIRKRLDNVQDDRSIWENQARKLRQWYFIYLGCWLGGIILFLIGFQVGSNAVNHAALFLFFGSLVPYVISIVYACKVQGNLHAARLVSTEAWLIVLWALIINPWGLGFFVPLSVLVSVRRVRKRLDNVQDDRFYWERD